MNVTVGGRISASRALEVTDCCVCGAIFAVPERLIANCRENAGHLYCPNGHRLGWSETESDRLRKRLEHERTRAGNLAAQRDQAEASLRAQKGQNTKLRKRVAAGVCPCCNRSFKNLSRHMANQHPNFPDTGEPSA